MADALEVAPPPNTGTWISRLGPTPGTVIPDPPVEPKKEPNGTPANPSANGNDKPVGDPPVAPAAAAVPAAQPPKPVVEPAKPDKPAAAPAAAVSDDDIDKEPTPKSEIDWKKFKEKYKGRTAEIQSALKKEFDARKEAEIKIVDYEKRIAEKPAADPEVAKQLADMQKLIDLQRDVIAQNDIAEEPRFKQHYTGRINSIIAEGKALVGEEKADALEKLLNLPEGEFKNMQLKAFRDEIDDEDTRLDVRLLTGKLRDVVNERDQERAKWNENGKKAKTLKQEQAAAEYQRQTQLFSTAFDAEVKKLGDPKDGNPLFQKIDGNEAWNKSVDDRIATAKNIIVNANNLKHNTIAQVALNAVAYPTLMNAFFAERKSWGEEKAKLEAQVKALSAAQPNGGAGRTAPKAAPEDPLAGKKDLAPFERNKLFAKQMVGALQDLQNGST
jgi:hypothetical protein